MTSPITLLKQIKDSLACSKDAFAAVDIRPLCRLVEQSNLEEDEGIDAALDIVKNGEAGRRQQIANVLLPVGKMRMMPVYETLEKTVHACANKVKSDVKKHVLSGGLLCSQELQAAMKISDLARESFLKICDMSLESITIDEAYTRLDKLVGLCTKKIADSVGTTDEL